MTFIIDPHRFGSLSPITASVLTANVDSTNRAVNANEPYSTASVGLTAGKLYLLAQQYQRSGADSTSARVAQSGATWTQITADIYAASDARLCLWRCQPASNVAAAPIGLGCNGSVTLIHMKWIVLEIDGVVDDSANNGAAAILSNITGGANPSGTSLNLTLPASVNAPDGMFGFFACSDNTSIDPGAGFTELADVTAETTALEAQWRVGNGTDAVGGSWTNTSVCQGIAVAVDAA